MKSNMIIKRWYIIFVLLLCLIAMGGCDNSGDTGDSTSSSPTVEELENSSKDKDEVIKQAIAVCEEVKLEVESIEEVDTAMIYINHESVLVALRLRDGSEEVSSEVRDKVREQVKEVYPKAITIAISSDDEVYQSIAKLVRSFKENDVFHEFIRDIKEIIDKL